MVKYFSNEIIIFVCLMLKKMCLLYVLILIENVFDIFDVRSRW